MERESVKVLQECIDLQNKKGQAYQSTQSSVQHADYYRKGMSTIYDILHAKMLRIRSIVESAESDPKYVPNFESIEDSLKDLINYASFGVAWMRCKVPGQKAVDMFNRPLPEKEKTMTSERWLAEQYPDIEIMSYDGWDKLNFEYSFHLEVISLQEFNKRLSLSTIKCKLPPTLLS